MTTAEQNAALARGFLIIKIGAPGETILPQNLEQFEQMRAESNLQTESFPRLGNEVAEESESESDSDSDSDSE
jgi:hypothetical protein